MHRSIFNFVFEITFFTRMKLLHLFFVCFSICVIAKQRTDSGFFLFEAEPRKKREKKKQKNVLKKSQEFMNSSDNDFV